MTRISQLPSETYKRILDLLPETEIRRLRLVCKYWDTYFRNEVGLRLVITNLNDEVLTQLCERDRKFSVLKFSNVTTTLGSVVPWSDRNFLTSLCFHRIVTSLNVLWSINRFKGLKHLTFSRIMLDNPAKGVNKDAFQLRDLRVITLYSKTSSGFGASESDYITHNLERFPSDEEYILSFLSSISCDKLARVNLLCSEEILTTQPIQELFDGRPFSHCTSCLTKLISKNRKSLKEFVAGEEINRLTIAWRFRPGVILWQTGMQLTYCETLFPIPTDWTTLFPVQRNLTFIKVNGAYRHWTSLHVGIRKSYKTITQVQLAGGGHGSSVDLERFDKCQKLVRLDLLLDDCYLRNVQCLPESLRHLSLNGPLTEDDLHAISMQLENLEYFYLYGNLPSYEYELYGNQFVLPATITRKVLEGFLTLPKIHTLTFHNTKMQVNEVTRWLHTIPDIEADLHPVPDYPVDLYGSLRITVPMRYTH